MTPAIASMLVFVGLHALLLVALVAGVRWVERQRAMGYPHSRARSVDRPAVIMLAVAGYFVANLVLAVAVTTAFDLGL
jgi:uncharacterized protein (DUF983 family)